MVRLRRGRSKLLAAALAAGLGAGMLAAIPPGAGAAPAPPRPIPPPVKVSISTGGFVPPNVVLVVGQTVEFTNDSGAAQSVTAEDATFDSGTIPPGGGFAMALGAPGSIAFSSTGNIAFTGRVTVGILDIAGAPTAAVKGVLPNIPIPPITELDEHPVWGIDAPRTRIIVAFQDNATVEQTNDALAQADVTLVGTIPGLNTVLVEIADPGPGNFDPVTAAEQTLQAHPAVYTAALDLVQNATQVPPPPENALGGDAEEPFSWTWQDARRPDGSGNGFGGNWGLEASRFPNAWNLIDQLTPRAATIPVETLVLDMGFHAHPDLADAEFRTLCQNPADPKSCTKDSRKDDHGTHTSGTVGATFGNPHPTQTGRSRGVDGGNPVVRLHQTPVNGLSAELTTDHPAYSTVDSIAEWDLVLNEKRPGGAWPDLRVVNYSIGEWSYKTDANKQAKWGRLFANKHCGPGADDDATGTGPCTPQTEDTLRGELSAHGLLLLRIAVAASNKNVMVAVAAGNESRQVCVVGNRVKQPPCAPGEEDPGQDTRLVSGFGWASDHFTLAADKNPIIMVEAYNNAFDRASFSNTNGDVSAPGTLVLSTVKGNDYGVKGGTSMATPHVTALISYLLAVSPTLTIGDVRRLLTDYARGDIAKGGKARIDAYSSLLAINGAAQDIVDVNDESLDGNRRVIRNQGGTEVLDTTSGPLVGARRMHSSPDGTIDMRDFRRLRDAVLQVCAGSPVEVPGCPGASQIKLDGGAEHPKKDLNFDGCVSPGTASCAQQEFRLSRFDFNGDATLTPLSAARLPLHDLTPTPTLAAGNLFTDLGLLQAAFADNPDLTEGWQAEDLPKLMVSADLEVHAGALFQRGAERVDVEVHYDDGTKAPVQFIEKKTGAVVVTVPVKFTGSPVKVVGVGHAANADPITSLVVEAELHPGEDTRVDLCVPTLVARAVDSQLTADGVDKTPVTIELTNCGRDPLEDAELTHELRRVETPTPPASTISKKTSKTNAAGRSVLEIRAGHELERLKVDITAKVDVDPTLPGPETITGELDIDVTPPLRMVYKWEQVTSDWSLHSELDASSFEPRRVTERRNTAPVVIGRTGHLTPFDGTGPGDGDDRASVRVSEKIDPSAIEFSQVITETPGGVSATNERMVVPTSGDEVGGLLLSPLILDFSEPNGNTRSEWILPNTYMDVAKDTVVVHNVDHVSAVHYEYGPTEDFNCDAAGVQCDGMFFLDQVGVAEREEGSAFQVAPELDAALTFTRKPDNTFSTYRWCSAPKTFAFAPRDGLGFFRQSGTATSKFRFIATITTDPDFTEADLELPDPDQCVEEQKPPIAAIARDFVTAKEGQMLKFVDASSDVNNDVESWQWDFGDGEASDEQFPFHRYEDDGNYRVELTVTDAAGFADTHAITIEVVNVAPKVDADDVQVASGDSVNLAVRIFDPGERDQEAVTLKRSFGGEAGLPVYTDQTIAAGSINMNLGVLPDGTHELTLTVTDKDGATGAPFTVTIDVGTGGTVEPDEDIETEGAPGCDFGVKLDTGESDFVDLVTLYRVANDLPHVYPSPTLTKAAEAHAAYLRDNDLFQHEGPGGNTPFDRAKTAQYPGDGVGENLARGPRSAASVMAGWQFSNPHNLNMLDPAWHAIGIAKVETPHGPLWVTVYGDETDCATEPPDLAPFAAASTASAPSEGHETEVLAWRTADPVPVIPVTAFTVSDATPDTGTSITVTNRSGNAVLDTGDGRGAFPIAAGATSTVDYLDPGAFTLSLTIGTRAAKFALDVGGVGRPLQITNQSAPGAAFGAQPTLRAAVFTADGLHPVANRTVTFAIAGRVAEAVTNTDGVASTPLVIDFGPAPLVLTITVPALPGGVETSITAAFTVTPNQAPVAQLNGPYDVLVGSGFVPNTAGTFDPDGLPLNLISFDLDGDGTFDDHIGSGFIPANVVSSKVCGGTCTPGVDKTITMRAVDQVGGQAQATAIVRFRRDFLLSVTPGNATVNPGGSISFQVGVITTSGFADPVVLSAPNLPAGVTASFQPPTVTPTGTSILTLTAAANAPSFDQSFTVRGTSGTIVHDATSVVDVEFGLIPECFGVLDVHVVDRDTGAPIPDVAIFNEPNVKTDANGNARLTKVTLNAGNSPRFAFIQSFHAAYWPNNTVSALAACGAPNSVEFKLAKIRSGAIAGDVVVGVPDPNNHSENRSVTATDIPIPDAFVDVSPSYGGTTDAAGHVSLPNIAMQFSTNLPLVTQFRANKLGYFTEAVPLTVQPDATTPVKLALVPQCFGAVDVRALDATTRLPVAGAQVDVQFLNGSRRGVTGENGRVRLEQIGLGRRNAATFVTAVVTTTVNGQFVGRNGAFRLEDCGSVGVVDVLLPVPVARTASLVGKITEAGTGLPIADAFVGAQVGGTRTNADGTYELRDMLIGFDPTTSLEVQVSASPRADTHLPASGFVTLVAGQTVTKDLELVRKKTGSLEVTVVDALTLQPVAGVSLTATNGGGGAHSGPDGKHTFTGLFTGNAPGQVGVFTFLPGYWNAAKSATVVPDETAHLQIPILRECAPATITGVVRNAVTSAPIELAAVRNTANFSDFVFTNAQGRFTWPNLRIANNEPFFFSLTATKEGFLSATKVVNLYCGARITADFGTPDTGHASLSGVVTNAATGAPVAGATVGSEWGAIDTTDAAGKYDFADVPMGGELAAKTWHIDVLAPNGSGLANATKNVTVHPNEAAVLDFALGAPTNQRPVVQDVHVDVPFTTSFVPLLLTGTDPDGDPLKFRMFTPTGGSIDNQHEGGGVNFTLAPGVTEGRYWYTATDGQADAVPAEVIITRGAPPATTTTTTTTPPSTTSTTTTVPPTTTSTTTTTEPPTSTTTTTEPPTTTTTTTEPPTTTTTTTTPPTTTTTTPPSTTTTSTAPVTTTTTTVPPTSTTTTSGSTTTSTSGSSTTSSSSTSTTAPATTSTSAASVSGATATTVPATAAPAGAPTTAAAVSPQSSTLPFTGGQLAALVALGLALLAAGAVLATRRRARI